MHSGKSGRNFFQEHFLSQNVVPITKNVGPAVGYVVFIELYLFCFILIVNQSQVITKIKSGRDYPNFPYALVPGQILEGKAGKTARGQKL